MKKKSSAANRILAIIVLITIGILAVGAYLLLPAYMNPESRSYTSAIGFLKVQRLLGFQMQAKAEHPIVHDFETPILGEGTLQSTYINVPIIPEARIKALYVGDGDTVHKGQLLAELDDTDAKFQLNAALSAVAVAKAQLQRVQAGTVNTLQAEQPDKARIDVENLSKIVKQCKAQVAMYRKMEADGASSKVQLSAAEVALANAQLNYEQARLSSGNSSQGAPQSIQIAQQAVADAENALAKKESDMKYYKVIAPAEGVIDRVLVHSGEFNQSAGNPSFIIASGLWFEANLDQRSVADIHEGMQASVNFESYPGRSIQATVNRVIPIVTFDAGGPETKSPVRPLGTGSPEWPATFRVRFQLQANDLKLAPGMTGFARVIASHEKALALPLAAVSSLSGGKGVVHLVNSEGHPVTTTISIGAVDGNYVQITGGLTDSDWVLTDSPRFLRDDDKIHVTRIMAATN